jgi:uncharacterized membrane protein
VFRYWSLIMLETAALGAGLSWASGIRLYFTILLAGALARFGVLELPESLQVLGSNWVLITAGILTVAEFVADKVPAFDSVWDAVHTFIRIPAGAILAAGAFGQLAPEWMAVAGLVGGTLAGVSHAAKSGTRALLNTSPEPFSNWTASAVEDVAVPSGLLLAIFMPVLFFCLLLIALLIAVWLLPKLWRGVRVIYQRLIRRFHLR